MRREIAVAVWLLAASGPLVAEEPPLAKGGGANDRLRDEIYEMVDAYVLMKVQERLGLTDEQLTRIMPLVRKQHLERRELEHRRHKTMGEMRRLLASGAAREEQVAGLLAEIRALEVEAPAAAKRNQDAIDAALTPLQQAKYRLLMAEVERRLRDLRRRARERGSWGGGRAGQGHDRGRPGEP